MLIFSSQSTENSSISNLESVSVRTYIVVYFSSALLALVVTPVVIWLARKLNVADAPGVRKVHARPIHLYHVAVKRELLGAIHVLRTHGGWGRRDLRVEGGGVGRAAGGGRREGSAGLARADGDCR